MTLDSLKTPNPPYDAFRSLSDINTKTYSNLRFRKATSSARFISPTHLLLRPLPSSGLRTSPFGIAPTQKKLLPQCDVVSARSIWRKPNFPNLGKGIKSLLVPPLEFHLLSTDRKVPPLLSLGNFK